MATSSDQIEADRALTRARMPSQRDRAGSGPRDAASLTETIGEQVRRRPIAALGLTLLAGSLLQDYLRGEQSSPLAQNRSPRPVGGATPRVAGTMRNAAEAALDTTRDAADAAGAVAGTVAGAARQVAETTGNVVDEVVDTAGDAVEQVSETTGDLVSTITEQVRQRPILAIGLSLAAGSLLQSYFAGGQGAPATARYTSSAAYRTPPTPSTADSTARRAMDTTRDAADALIDTTRNVADTVIDTTRDTAGAVVGTTTRAARRVAETTGDVVDEIVDTAGQAVDQVSETVGGIMPALRGQFEERPLATMGVTIATGMLLQPTLAPYIGSATTSVRNSLRTVVGDISDTFALPEQPEVNHLKATLVPATVERAKQFTNRELREYLDQSLETVVGQTSLRAGLVAAATERAEGLVDTRLADLLNRNLNGTRGLLALALVGGILRARGELQQGQGATLSAVKTNLAQSLTQSARDQLLQYFPEFRQQYQSAPNTDTKRCSNCNATMPAGARFCPTCGTAAAA